MTGDDLDFSTGFTETVNTAAAVGTPALTSWLSAFTRTLNSAPARPGDCYARSTLIYQVPVSGGIFVRKL